MQGSNQKELPECLLNTNCVLLVWEFQDVHEKFKELVNLAKRMQRVSTLEESNNYWHGIIRSLIFRFPDDLEILKIPQKRIIQIKSASRFGVGDLGVNRNRLQYLYKQLTNQK